MAHISKLQQQHGPNQKPTRTGDQDEPQDDDDEDGPGSECENLDSGYAWVILVVMFLIQSSIGGSARLYGLVYAKEVAVGYYDREQASWPIATSSAVENLAGILSPALVQWLSWRNIELISAGLFVTANVLAYLSDSLALDIIALGLIQGLALSSCTVLALIINNDYFERYRTTAYGISMCGSTFGLLYLGPLVNWLLDNYEDFRLVYLALACVFSFNVLLVLFIRPRAQAPRISCGRKRRDQSVHKQAEATAAAAANTDNNNKTTSGLPSPAVGRKRSRFETHFLERRESVATISHMARSRRNSVLSRVIPTGQSAASCSQQQQQQASYASHQLHPALAKSQSGIELASKLANSQKLGNQALMKKVSLGSMLGPTATDPSGPQPAVTGSTDTLDRPLHFTATPISNRGSQISLTKQISLAAAEACSCTILPPGSKTAKTNSCTPGKCLRVTTDLEAASPTPATDPEVELDVASLYRQLALEYEAQGRPTDTKTSAQNLKEPQKDQLQKQQQQQQQRQQQRFSVANLAGLLRLPYLHCIWIMLALYYLIARIFVIILVDFAHDHGLDEAQSTALVNYWSFGELLGRLLLGSLIDLQFLSCRSCIGLTCSLLATLMGCMVLFESYYVYAFCSLWVAALISLECMLINVLMVEYVGKQMVTNCYSLAACISSPVLFGRPTMIGFFRDRLGSYDGLLLMLAALAGSYGVIFYLVEPLLVRCWPKNRQQSE